MYEKRFTHIINEVISSLGDINSTHGEVFWVNNSAVVNTTSQPTSVYHGMA